MKNLILLFNLFLSLSVFSQTAPSINTNAATSITQLRAICGGTLVSQGDSAVTNVGLVWGTSPNPTIFNGYEKYKLKSPIAVGASFTNWIAPLLPNTVYYVRAFAISAVDTTYGNQITFTTPQITSNQKYYFSSSGNDANNGLSPNTPKKTLRELQRLVTNGNVTFLPGDTIFFKRGDLFDNGYDGVTVLPGQFTFVSCSFMNRPFDDYTAPSGTSAKPIVITNYGDANLPLPNFLFPTASSRTKGGPIGNVIGFAGVSYLTIDGIQFNDFRFPNADKANPAYTTSCILLGENGDGSWNDTIQTGKKVRNFILRNSYFNNVAYAVGSLAGIRCEIYNNVVTNLRSTIDTLGVNDVGSGGFEALNGYYNQIYKNYVKGAWSKSGRVSSTSGLMGVGCDIFNLKYSSIKYNTFVDCSGAFEIGNIDNLTVNSGAQYDTIAYNKIVNCSNMIYLHGSGTFAGYVRSIYLFNNVVINNQKSRIAGPNFGGDPYGDGQSFSGNAQGQYGWWFFKNPLLCTDWFVRNGTIANGSPTITMSSSGVQVGAQVWDYDALTFKTVISTTTNTVTVNSNYTSSEVKEFRIYPPATNTNYSYPQNPPFCNYGGYRIGAQYTENFLGNPDTVVDLRNNIFWCTTGGQIGYGDSRLTQKKSYNIYHLKNAVYNSTVYQTVLGSSLGVGEVITTAKIFADTSDALPENWDLRIADVQFANRGTTIPGFSKDFGGAPITGVTDIGLYEYSAKPQLVLVSSTNVTCKTATNGTISVSASGGSSPYTFRRGTLPYQSSGNFSNLAPGTYVITVKDSKGLTSTLNVTIKSSNINCP